MNHSLLDVLLYLPAKQNYLQKAQGVVVEEEEEEFNLETGLEDPVELPKDDNDDLALVRYVPLEEQLFETTSSYAGEPADDSLYKAASHSSYEEAYVSASAVNDDAEAGISLSEEMIGTLKDLKYDFIVTSVDVDFEQQEKIANWILFHSAEYAFLESINRSAA